MNIADIEEQAPLDGTAFHRNVCKPLQKTVIDHQITDWRIRNGEYP